MIYPETFEQKLEFSKIRENIKQKCLFEAGRELINQLGFCDDYQMVSKLINQVDEFKTII